jgi:hypothetical protein
MGSLPIEEHYVRFEVFTAVNMKKWIYTHPIALPFPPLLIG